MKEMKLMSACKDFFGLKPGQTAIQFLAEYKQLTDADKVEISAGLEHNGYKIIAG